MNLKTDRPARNSGSIKRLYSNGKSNFSDKERNRKIRSMIRGSVCQKNGHTNGWKPRFTPQSGSWKLSSSNQPCAQNRTRSHSSGRFWETYIRNGTGATLRQQVKLSWKDSLRRTSPEKRWTRIPKTAHGFSGTIKNTILYSSRERPGYVIIVWKSPKNIVRIQKILDDRKTSREENAKNAFCTLISTGRRLK